MFRIPFILIRCLALALVALALVVRACVSVVAGGAAAAE